MTLNVSNQDHEGQIARLGRDSSMRATFDFAQVNKLDYGIHRDSESPKKST